MDHGAGGCAEHGGGRLRRVCHTQLDTEGERLALGEPALITFPSPEGDGDAELEVTVLAVREVSREDFAETFPDLTEEDAALTPYQVDIRVDQRSGVALPGFGPNTYMVAENTAGEASRSPFVMGGLGPGCQRASTDGEGEGFPIETCELFLVDGTATAFAWVGTFVEERAPIRWMVAE